MNILLVAEESAGLQALRLVHQSLHNLVAVLTHKPETKAVSNIYSTAEKMGYKVLSSPLVKEATFAHWVKQHQIDLLLNVHALHIIHPHILNAVNIGAFNIHPGPLPQYAGLNAPSWAIFNGESKHAVTIHWLSPQLDAGPIAYQSWFSLNSSDTGLSVSAQCSQKAIPLLHRLLEDANAIPPTIPRIKQKNKNRRVYKRNEIPWNGIIQWEAPAKQIDALVRACNYVPFTSPWGSAKTWLEDQQVNILQTQLSQTSSEARAGTIVATTDNRIMVATGDTVLEVTKITDNQGITYHEEILEPGTRFYYPTAQSIG
jgi:methionyl-tRNA formyltransferase